MPNQQLSPAELRLGLFARVTAVLYLATGLFFAFLPELSLRIAASGAALPLGPGARLWHVLALSMMAMLAVCSWMAGKAPRERRALLVPVLVSKATSTLAAALFALSWTGDPAGRRTLLSAIATDLPLLLATLWLYQAAAPGVNQLAQPTQRAEEPAKPVQLGLAKAASPSAPPK